MLVNVEHYQINFINCYEVLQCAAEKLSFSNQILEILTMTVRSVRVKGL